jgi:hypothetical protein
MSAAICSQPKTISTQISLSVGLAAQLANSAHRAALARHSWASNTAPSQGLFLSGRPTDRPFAYNA